MKQEGVQLEPYSKFADLCFNHIYEENLLISCDGTEVLFKVVQEIDQKLTPQIISLDLVKKQLKVWSKNFEQSILSALNPYSYRAKDM